MNHVNFKVTVLLLSLLLSCTTEHESPWEDTPTSLTTQRIPIKFHMDLAQEILPFTTTKASCVFTISEPVSKAEEEGGTSPTDPTTPESAPDKYYDYLEYVVYTVDSDIPLKCSRFGLQGEETNGISASVVDSLLPGTYHFCFLAHSDAQMAIDETTATFSKVGDTFHHYVTLEIGEGEEVVQHYTLQRIVGRIEFVSTDKVADNLASLHIKVENYPYSIDLTTGIGCSSDELYERTDVFAEAQRGQTRQTHSFYSFQPSTGEQLSIYLTAKDLDGNTTRLREEITSSPEWNRIIRYTGVLYTPKVSDDTFNIEIEKDWDSTVKDTDIGK